MYKIIEKKVLNSYVTALTIEAPFIAKKVQPGQFVIIRIDEKGERIPLTVADFDKQKGSITIIFHAIGYTTKKLSQMICFMRASATRSILVKRSLLVLSALKNIP